MVSSFLQQNPHLFQQLYNAPADDTPETQLDFTALKLTSHEITEEQVIQFLKALKPVETNSRAEYCKVHMGHKLTYMQRDGSILCEICLTDPMAETDSEV